MESLEYIHDEDPLRLLHHCGLSLQLSYSQKLSQI